MPRRAVYAEDTSQIQQALDLLEVLRVNDVLTKQTAAQYNERGSAHRSCLNPRCRRTTTVTETVMIPQRPHVLQFVLRAEVTGSCASRQLRGFYSTFELVSWIESIDSRLVGRVIAGDLIYCSEGGSVILECCANDKYKLLPTGRVSTLFYLRKLERYISVNVSRDLDQIF